MTKREAGSLRVSDLGLSTRAADCLRNKNIDTVYELVQKDEAWLMDQRNFGRISLVEVESKLASLGLHLGMQAYEWDIDSSESSTEHKSQAGADLSMAEDPRVELQSKYNRPYKNFPEDHLSHLYSAFYDSLKGTHLRKCFYEVGCVLTEFCFRDAERAVAEYKEKLEENHFRELAVAKTRIKSLETQNKNLKAKAEGV